MSGINEPMSTECVHETLRGLGKCFGALTGALTADLLLQIEYYALAVILVYLVLVQSRI